MNRIFVGIDPGTTTSSTGLIVESEGRILNALSVQASEGKIKDDARKFDKLDRPVMSLAYRIDWIVKVILGHIICHLGGDKHIRVVCEEPFLLGKANKNMLKFFGALECGLVGNGIPISYINPSTSKKLVGGHGAADKMQVLQGVLKGYNLPNDKIFRENGNLCFDISDAAAAVLAWKLKQGAV